MEVVALVLFRIIAAIVGAACFVVFNPGKCARECCVSMIPGVAVGVFLAPLVCDALLAYGGWSWLHCGEWKTDGAAAVLGGLMGNTATGLLLKYGPEWLRLKLGLDVGAPIPPRTYVRPDSDLPKV